MVHVDHEHPYRAPAGDEVEPRVLVTLLFTDLVGSTRLAAALGDRRWTLLLRAHHAKVRNLLECFGGHEVDDAGDGFFATFTAATPAVRCAAEVSVSLRELGLTVRVGLHTAECVEDAGRVRGVAVHVGARVVQHADPGEVLVTRTVRDVVAGSDLAFEERGAYALRGLPGAWELFAVVQGNGHSAVLGTPRHVPRARRRVSLVAGSR